MAEEVKSLEAVERVVGRLNNKLAALKGIGTVEIKINTGKSGQNLDKLLARISTIKDEVKKMEKENPDITKSLGKNITSVITKMKEDVREVNTEIKKLVDNFGQLYNALGNVQKQVNVVQQQAQPKAAKPIAPQDSSQTSKTPLLAAMFKLQDEERAIEKHRMTNWGQYLKTLGQAMAQTGYQANQGVSGIKRFRDALNETSQIRPSVFKTLAEGFDKITGGIGKIILWQARWYATKTLIFGTTDAIRDGIKAFFDFDQALRNIQAITGSTQDQMKGLAQTITLSVTTTKFNMSQLAEGATVLAQAGLSAKQVQEVLPQVANLATASLTDMKVTTDLVTSALSSFQLEATDSAKVVDIFANATDKSKLTVDDLRTAMSYIGPVASQAGMSLTEAATAMALLRNKGIAASSIGTGFSTLLGSLMAPSKKLKEVLDTVGLSLEDISPRFKSFGDVIETFKRSGITTEQVFQGFDKRVAKVFLALVAEGKQGFDRMSQGMEAMGSTALKAETQMLGLDNVLTSLKANAQTFIASLVRIGVGSNFVQSLDAIRLIFIRLNEQITLFPESFGKTLDKIVGWAENMGEAFVAVFVAKLGTNFVLKVSATLAKNTVVLAAAGATEGAVVGEAFGVSAGSTAGSAFRSAFLKSIGIGFLIAGVTFALEKLIGAFIKSAIPKSDDYAIRQQENDRAQKQKALNLLTEQYNGILNDINSGSLKNSAEIQKRIKDLNEENRDLILKSGLSLDNITKLDFSNLADVKTYLSGAAAEANQLSESVARAYFSLEQFKKDLDIIAGKAIVPNKFEAGIEGESRKGAMGISVTKKASFKKEEVDLEETRKNIALNLNGVIQKYNSFSDEFKNVLVSVTQTKNGVSEVLAFDSLDKVKKNIVDFINGIKNIKGDATIDITYFNKATGTKSTNLVDAYVAAFGNMEGVAQSALNFQDSLINIISNSFAGTALKVQAEVLKSIDASKEAKQEASNKIIDSLFNDPAYRFKAAVDSLLSKVSSTVKRADLRSQIEALTKNIIASFTTYKSELKKGGNLLENKDADKIRDKLQNLANLLAGRDIKFEPLETSSFLKKMIAPIEEYRNLQNKLAKNIEALQTAENKISDLRKQADKGKLGPEQLTQLNELTREVERYKGEVAVLKSFSLKQVEYRQAIVELNAATDSLFQKLTSKNAKLGDLQASRLIDAAEYLTKNSQVLYDAVIEAQNKLLSLGTKSFSISGLNIGPTVDTIKQELNTGISEILDFSQTTVEGRTNALQPLIDKFDPNKNPTIVAALEHIQPGLVYQFRDTLAKAINDKNAVPEAQSVAKLIAEALAQDTTMRSIALVEKLVTSGDNAVDTVRRLTEGYTKNGIAMATTEGYVGKFLDTANKVNKAFTESIRLAEQFGSKIPTIDTIYAAQSELINLTRQEYTLSIQLKEKSRIINDLRTLEADALNLSEKLTKNIDDVFAEAVTGTTKLSELPTKLANAFKIPEAQIRKLADAQISLKGTTQETTAVTKETAESLKTGYLEVLLKIQKANLEDLARRKESEQEILDSLSIQLNVLGRQKSEVEGILAVTTEIFTFEENLTRILEEHSKQREHEIASLERKQNFLKQISLDEEAMALRLQQANPLLTKDRTSAIINRKNEQDSLNFQEQRIKLQKENLELALKANQADRDNIQTKLNGIDAELQTQQKLRSIAERGGDKELVQQADLEINKLMAQRSKTQDEVNAKDRLLGINRADQAIVELEINRLLERRNQIITEQSILQGQKLRDLIKEALLKGTSQTFIGVADTIQNIIVNSMTITRDSVAGLLDDIMFKMNEFNQNLKAQRDQQIKEVNSAAKIEQNQLQLQYQQGLMTAEQYHQSLVLLNANSLVKRGEAEAKYNEQKKKLDMDYLSKYTQDFLKSLVRETISAINKMIAAYLMAAAARALAGMGYNADLQTASTQFGWSDSAQITRAKGGPVPKKKVQKFDIGGLINQFAGVPNQDSVPILAMGGEFVIKKSAVDTYGADFFHRLNNMYLDPRKLPKYAKGGEVGNTSSRRPTTAPVEEREIRIYNFIDPRSLPQQPTKDDIINVIRLDAVNNGPGIQTVRQTIRG